MMNLIYIEKENKLLNMNHVRETKSEPEVVTVAGSAYPEYMTTDNFVVTMDGTVVFKSQLKEKCDDYLVTFTRAICKAAIGSVVVLTKDGKIRFRKESFERYTFPDDTWYDNLNRKPDPNCTTDLLDAPVV